MAKKKKKKARPGKEYLEIPVRTTVPNETVKLEFDELGQVYVRQSGGPVKITRSRKRESDSTKPKMIATMNIGENRGYTTIWETVKSRYDQLIAIDSGRFYYQNNELCVVSSAYTKEPIKYNDSELKAFFFDSFIFQSNSVHEEIIGWHILFTSILPQFEIFSGNRICLVTDHQEQLHEALNLRQTPYYLDNYIPDNIDVLYAGDSGDHGLNIALRSCHKKCNEVIKKVKESNVVFPTIKNINTSEYNIVSRVVFKSCQS